MKIAVCGFGVGGYSFLHTLRELEKNTLKDDPHFFPSSVHVWDPSIYAPCDLPALSKELTGRFFHSLDGDIDTHIKEKYVRTFPFTSEALTHVAQSSLQKISKKYHITFHHEAAPQLHYEAQTASWHILDEHYDAAVLSLGSTAHILHSSEGKPSYPQAFHIQNPSQVANLGIALAKATRVDILGAGWIGLECASALSPLLKTKDLESIHIWEKNEHVFGGKYGSSLNSLWQKWCTEAGVTLHLGSTLPDPLHILYSRVQHPKNILIEAVGATPRPLPPITIKSDTRRIPFPSPSPSEVNILASKGKIGNDFLLQTPVHVDEYCRPLTPTDAQNLFILGDSSTVIPSWVQESSTLHLSGGHWLKAMNDGARVAHAIHHIHVEGAATPLPQITFLPPAEVFSTQFGHDITFFPTNESTHDIDIVDENTSPAHALTLVHKGRGILIIDNPRATAKVRKALRIMPPRQL